MGALAVLVTALSCGDDDDGACRNDDDCGDGLRCDPDLGCVPDGGDGDADGDGDSDGDSDTDADGDGDGDADGDGDGDGDADQGCARTGCEPGSQCVGDVCVPGDCVDCADPERGAVCCMELNGEPVCADLLSDPAHCGSCDEDCGAAGSCIDGACRCDDAAGGGVLCEGVCVDTANDPRNCGDCGRFCPDNAPTCVGGQCTGCPECPDLEGQECPDFENDPLNCGQCGHVCVAGTQCIAAECQGGTCDNDCNAEQPICCRVEDVNVCVNLRTSTDHCGSCQNPCEGDTPCVNGHCGQ